MFLAENSFIAIKLHFSSKFSTWKFSMEILRRYGVAKQNEELLENSVNDRFKPVTSLGK